MRRKERDASRGSPRSFTAQGTLVQDDNSATCCLGWYLSDCVGLIHLIANPVSLTAEKQRGRGSRVAYWALAVVFLAVYVGSMFTPGLLDDADSTHAEAAREMVVTGDYVTLHVNGVRYLEKPPLPYWLVAISYKLFGVNEFSTRLPMVLVGDVAGGVGVLLGAARVRGTDRDLCGIVRLHLRGRVLVYAGLDS